MIVIDLFDIAVGRCFLIFLDEKYFALLLLSVRIIFSLIRVVVKRGEYYILISIYPCVVLDVTQRYPPPSGGVILEVSGAAVSQIGHQSLYVYGL